MSREGSYDAFKRWAEKERDRDRRRPCIYCGYPTRSESQTCPAHRDLAPPIENLLLDAEPTVVLEGGPDDAGAGMDRGRVGESLAPDPAESAGRVDRSRP